MKLSSYLIIVLGISLILYPPIKNFYESYQETTLLKKWENKKPQQLEKNFIEVNRILSKPEKDNNTDQKISNDNVLGILIIKKINLKLPILEGADQKTLRLGAGHLPETSPIGITGNAAIAAHRNYTYGSKFNRLNELEVGDQITIETNNKVMVYRTIKKFTVFPTDISVLKQSSNQSIITLITCEPMKNPTKRLIVQAYLEEPL
jgi:sortase A